MKIRLFNILILFIFISFVNCKIPYFNKLKFDFFKKNNNQVKKNIKLSVVIDAEYSKTEQGNLAKKILIDFFKKNKIKDYSFKKIDSKKINAVLKNNKSDIIIYDNNNTEYNFNNNKLSLPVFINSVYFLIHPEDFRIYGNNLFANIYKMKTGVLYETFGYQYLINNFPDVKKYYYKDKDNLILDFEMNKLDLVIMDRFSLYENIWTLPYINLYYVEYGNAYGQIFFKSNYYKERFNYYLNIKRDRYEWIELIYQKPKEIKYVEDYIKKLDIDLNKKL